MHLIFGFSYLLDSTIICICKYLQVYKCTTRYPKFEAKAILYVMFMMNTKNMFTESEAACRAGSMIVPQPEAAIENSVCRERLLKHIQQCQTLVESRLDSIEAQVVGMYSIRSSLQNVEMEARNLFCQV